MDLFKLARNLHDELKSEGIEFTEAGFPIFPEEILLKEKPDAIIPMRQKYAIKDPSKTLLCTFDNDEYIYKRLFSLKEDIPFYNSHMGVVGFDLSPRINWLLELQNFNIMLNQMASAYIGVHGAKLMLNFRTGSTHTYDCLAGYPPGAWYVAGSLGCSRGHIPINEMYLRSKILMTRPDTILYYGGLKPEYKKILDEFEIDYYVYPDFKKNCFTKGD